MLMLYMFSGSKTLECHKLVAIEKKTGVMSLKY